MRLPKHSLAISAAILATGIALTGCAATPPDTKTPAANGELSLAGKVVGIAVVGTQHFWDREAFQGAIDEVERLGGTVITTDGGRDNTVHAQNHEVFLSQGVDAVITILGDDSVEPKLAELKSAGIPVFGVDRDSSSAVNNSQSDNEVAG